MLDLSLEKSLDSICVGRAGMDLYAAEDNTDFFEVSSFRKSVGGSPANIAVGMARLGARSAILTRLSEDVVGQYVKQFMLKEGVDTSSAVFDSSGTRTSLALTEIRPENCAVVIYRNNAADLALCESDIDAQQIASSRMLIVSGTALCAEPSRSATLKAIDIAASHNVVVALDLDYRAYIWNSVEEAAEVYQQAARLSTIVFGNTEEFAVLCIEDGQNKIGDDAEQIANFCLSEQTRAVFIKAGAAGSSVYFHQTAEGVNSAAVDATKSCSINQPGDIMVLHQSAFAVQTRKPFGAGDAYAAAICSALCRGDDMSVALRQGAAAAAIVVAGGSCCESSPTLAELEAFLHGQAQG